MRSRNAAPMNRRALSFFMLGLLVGTPLAMAALVPAIQSARTDPARANPARTKIVLKLGHVLPASHPVHTSMEFMARRVAELSASAVELQVFGGSLLGTGPELLADTQHGTLSGMKTTAAALEEFVPEMAVFGMPYLFRSDDHYWNVLLGEIGKEILRAVEAHDLHGLCYYDGGARSFYTVRKPILEPTDIQGMKLRVMESNKSEEMIITLGGVPA